MDERGREDPRAAPLDAAGRPPPAAVWITPDAVGALLEAWRRPAGAEPCGLLLGGVDRAGIRVREVAALPNRHATPDRAFLLDPADQTEARRAAEARGLAVVGYWHGHLRGGPFPGWQDREGAEAAARAGGIAASAMLIAGCGSGGHPVLRAFVPRGRRLIEVPLRR
jgi:proteasome lid subunit RPN8/RPN11